MNDGLSLVPLSDGHESDGFCWSRIEHSFQKHGQDTIDEIYRPTRYIQVATFTAAQCPPTHKERKKKEKKGGGGTTFRR